RWHNKRKRGEGADVPFLGASATVWPEESDMAAGGIRLWKAPGRCRAPEKPFHDHPHRPAAQPEAAQALRAVLGHAGDDDRRLFHAVGRDRLADLRDDR